MLSATDSELARVLQLRDYGLSAGSAVREHLVAAGLLRELLTLQQRARQRPLEPAEVERYGALRTELAGVVFALLHTSARHLGESTRRCVRVDRRLPVHIRFRSDLLRGPLSTLDLCEEGFAAELRESVEVGDGVHVRLDLPSGEPLLSHARVAHRREAGDGRLVVGFELLDVDGAYRERLRALVNDELLARLR